MSKIFCVQCNQEHEDHTWKLIDKGWICRKYFNPSRPAEFVPERTKQERKEYFKSTIQPRRDGVASKEFMEAYPKQADKTFNDYEKKNAKYTLKDLPGWEHRHKSK